MFRKAVVALGVTVGVIGLGASSAFALDCSNVSRPAPTLGTPVFTSGPFTIWVIQGDWWFISGGPFGAGAWDKIPPGTASSVLGFSLQQAEAIGLPAGAVNGNYQGGNGFGLLDIAQAPCNTNRQTTNGIQAGSTRCPGP